MSKIQKELAKVAEVEPKRGETIDDEAYKKRLIVAVGEISDDDWEKLSKPAQDWFNTNADLINAKKPPEGWPDAEKSEEAPTRRRSKADDEDAPAAKKDADAVKKGDKVRVVTKRGKEYVGEVVDPDDKGELVVKTEDDEVGIDLECIDTLEVLKDKKDDEDAKPRRRRAAEDDEPAGPKEPAVGDTVEVTTNRGKVYLGNVVDLDDKGELVLKTPAGDEIGISLTSIKSILVKVDNSSAKEDAKPRRSSAKEDPAPAGDGVKKRASKEDNGGVSVTTRARELICDDPSADKEGIMKLLKKEGLEFKENTIQLIFADCHKLFGMLRARKMMK